MSYPPFIRRRRRRRRPINLALALVCTGLCLCAGLFEKPAQTPRDAATIRTAPDSYDAPLYLPALSDVSFARRPVYPYSVIPGGVLNRAELARAIDRDPVVARHYSHFGTTEARIVRAQDEKLVHVSYRMDNKVFWSVKKVRLARGETLLTDGHNLARTRCGNRVSVLPQEPTSPEEPPVEALESPAVPEKTETVFVESRLDIGDPSRLFANLGHNALTLPVLLNPQAVNGWSPPYIPPIVPMSPAPQAVTPPVSPGTLPDVPEPSTIVLLSSGLAAAALLRVRSRRKR
jgi:hypothetical protein